MGWDPIAVIEGGVISYVRADHIGRPVFATNSTGVKVWSAVYTPFGGVHTSTGTIPSNRFPGQWFQSENGLHQNWMRDYDPTTGRYIQADPLGLVDGASVYGYALQNPGRYFDKMGLFTIPQRPPEKVCLMPSQVPQGYDYNANISEAEEYFWRFADKGRWFYDQVRNKGPWDYKQKGSQYQDFGNWNYGATGAAAGFTGPVLKTMAGYAQQQAGTSRPEWGKYYFPGGGNGDDPSDQVWIQRGIDFYENGCMCENGGSE